MRGDHLSLLAITALTLTLFVWPSIAQADLVILSGNRSVASSGFASSDYWDYWTNPPYTEQQAANWTDSHAAAHLTTPFASSAGGSVTLDYSSANGGASQNSSIGSGSLTASGAALGGWQDSGGGNSGVGASGTGHSQDSSVFDVTFRVTQPTEISLTGHVGMNYSDVPDAYSFVELNGTGGTLFNTLDTINPSNGPANSAFSYSSLLGAGTYTLDAEALMNTLVGNIDYPSSGASSFALFFDPGPSGLRNDPIVPEPTSLLLLALGLGGALVRRALG